MDAGQLASFIKEKAREHGFSFCGISKAEFLEDEAPRLESWLKNGYHGKMAYMENHFDKRLNPTLLVDGAKSVISLLYNYYPKNDDLSKGDAKISRYAYGQDYHRVIKDILFKLVNAIEEKTGKINGRVFTDSAPVLERAWAAKSGLGWMGKNAMVINREMGSYFFLAEIISDLNPATDGPIKDYCGTCTACIDACPTDAIINNKVIDSNKCISYLTIELKDEIDKTLGEKMENWIFGCDICQEVCPWNRFSSPHRQPLFEPSEALTAFSLNDWNDMNEETFKLIARNSPIKRTGYKGLTRNIRFLRK